MVILLSVIKSVNILITSLVMNEILTDFGSSRNVFMLITFMTFTKGVESPVYIPPDVLRKEFYNKKVVVIYSFGVKVFECLI